MISFVGAGPGAADLLTLRAVQRLASADIVLWAGSLVSSEVLAHCRPDAELHDTKSMTLEQVTAVFERHPDAAIVRLHSGDPSIYSSINEQIAWCVAEERCFEVVPGVSSVSAAAAAVAAELTVPGISQSVILTRLARRTVASLGAGDDFAAMTALGTVMALFLSAGDPTSLQTQLLAPGSAYTADTPAVIAHRVSWPDEQLITTTVGQIAAELVAHGITMSALVLVGDALASARPAAAGRSHVYDPAFTHSHRTAIDG
ncbi:MAG: Uroporphyrin-III C/tetrapyrrole (Corrin/Porphyrin) methyltransferase [Ilumatobacteraceae bacterium]|nr:Uroporphyrin-III C/tetrapyrrole (Corrin/Porphyrin) methyltransferase [Ilumatobacteraceae bacterium]